MIAGASALEQKHDNLQRGEQSRAEDATHGAHSLEPIVLSASQISTWRGCKRQWAFKYIERIETPSTPAQLLGTEVENEQLQPYLLQGRAFEYTTKDGKKRDSAEIAASSLAYLPKPMTPGLELQRHFLMPSPTWIGGVHSGVSYQGYIDMWHRDSRTFPDFEGHESGLVIPSAQDFKTTKDLKYRKKEGALSIDVQAMLYATHALYATRAPAVDLGWIYMRTQGGRKAERTKLRVFPDHVAEQFQELDATGQEIARIRRLGNKGEIKALDLEPNPDHCGAFGGCPFQSKCNLSPSQIIDAQAARANRLLDINLDINKELKRIEPMTMQTGGMSMLDQLRAKKAAADQGVAATPAQVSPPALSSIVAKAATQPAPVPPLLPSPAPASIASVVAAAIAGVAEDGTNVYTHETQNYQYLGQSADGRNVYRRNPHGLTAAVAAPAPMPVAVAAPVPAYVAQPINPPESALAPAAPVGELAPKKGPGRPRKTEAAPAAAANMSGPNLDDAIKFAQAMRSGCDAFLVALGFESYGPKE